MQEVNNNLIPLYGTRMYKKNVSHLPDLIRECEQSRRSPIDDFSNFVPVKQKRMMFEGSLICSSKSVDNLHDIPTHTANVKSKSMHNLDLSAVPVKDICRYFENRFNANEKKNVKFRSLYQDSQFHGRSMKVSLRRDIIALRSFGLVNEVKRSKDLRNYYDNILLYVYSLVVNK